MDDSAVVLNEDNAVEGGADLGLAGQIKVNTHRLDIEKQNSSNAKKLGLVVQTKPKVLGNQVDRPLVGKHQNLTPNVTRAQVRAINLKEVSESAEKRS